MIRRIREQWRHSEPVEFESAYGLAESIERLKAVTQRSVFAVLVHPAAVGTVKASRVSLQRVIPMVGNSFKPCFVGRFEQRGSRVVLTGRFTMFWFVKLFLGFWFGFCALAIVASTLITVRSGRNPMVALAAVGMLFAGAGVVRLGVWFSRKDQAWLSDVIRGALATPGIPPPKPPPTSRSMSQWPPTFMVVAAGLFAVMGLMSIVFAMTGIQSLYTAAGGTAVTHFTSTVPRYLAAGSGVILIALGYGIYRQRLLAWWLGFIVLVGWQTYSVVTLFRQNLHHARGGIGFFAVASAVIVLIWGRWWFAQRVRFGHSTVTEPQSH
ncbi:MAG: hypothetical protein ACYDHY_13640 [Acidiferrobacterales bacterium]